MGAGYDMKCNDCGEQFQARIGGSMSAEQLRCWRCGDATMVGYEDMGLLALRRWGFRFGLDSFFLWGLDELAATNPELIPITDVEYNRAMERKAGRCSCGGRYQLIAPMRCPRCRSIELTEGEVYCHYD